jgi:LysM repeat protein
VIAVAVADDARRFGFSGRNFYVQFRLFADVLRNSRADLARADWPRIDPSVEVAVGRHLDWPSFVERCGLHPAVLKALNMGITELGWEGVLWLPPEARVRFPRAQLERVQKCLAGPAQAAMHEAQRDLARYRLRPGDNLTRVAERLGCTPFDLMLVNDIDRDAAARLAVGTRVRVPTRRYAELAEQVESWAARGRPRPLSFAPYTVRAGDDVEAVEKRHGLAHPELVKWNDLTGWTPGLIVHVPEYGP